MTTGQETTRLPVRSALFKQRTGGLVVRWVTTSEYPLLYVFAFLCEFYTSVSACENCYFLYSGILTSVMVGSRAK